MNSGTRSMGESSHTSAAPGAFDPNAPGRPREPAAVAPVGDRAYPGFARRRRPRGGAQSRPPRGRLRRRSRSAGSAPWQPSPLRSADSWRTTTAEAPHVDPERGLSSAEVAERVARGKSTTCPPLPRASRMCGPTSSQFNAILGAMLAIILVVGPLQDALFGIVLVANAASASCRSCAPSAPSIGSRCSPRRRPRGPRRRPARGRGRRRGAR